MIVYKAFEPNLKCRGYQFKEGKLNKTDKANCRQNGFHAAENPLDCLTYYDWDKAVFYICSAGGDIDEDDVDSKISCTELALVHRLTLPQFLFKAVTYMVSHPLRECSHHVNRETADIERGFTVVRGKHPQARGQLGCYIALLQEKATTEHIDQVALFKIDGKDYMPGVWYDVRGQEVRDYEDTAF